MMSAKRNARRARLTALVTAGLTLRQVAAAEGITGERVRQIIGGSVWTLRPKAGPRQPIGLDGRESRTVRRFWARVRVERDGCWTYMGSHYPTGYGHSRRYGYAHREAFTAVNGPIPNGLTLDHLCRNRGCVNPAHLEAVSTRTNVLRSPIAPAAINARKTHCIRGHEFTTANTRQTPQPNGSVHRECRSCQRGRNAAYMRRKRAQQKAAIA